MNRTQITHVRKFGGVWYQLIEAMHFHNECFRCDYLICLQTSVIPNYECFPRKLTEMGIYYEGGIWKEIGEI